MRNCANSVVCLFPCCAKKMQKVSGANPANDQPVTTKYFHEAKKLGTKFVVVNPYREPGLERYWVPSTASSALFGSSFMDYWFPVSQGGDIAFLYGVIKILVDNNW